MSSQRRALLNYLAAHGGTSSVDVAAALSLNERSVASRLRVLVACGWVECEPQHNRKASLWAITATGYQELRAKYPQPKEIA